MNRHYSIEIVNRVSELNRIFEMITKFSLENSLSRDCDYNLNLILEEYFLNLIKYGYKDGRKDIIVVNIELSIDGMRIKVTDSADSFDIRNAEDYDSEMKLEDRRVGGIGIKLIKALVKRIDYEKMGENNIATFICSK